MTTGENVQVFVQKATGGVVEITDYVRYRRVDLEASAGRSTELDESKAPGTLTLGLDNSDGTFTPGRSGSSVQLTLGMPVWITETLGYRTFPIFSGFLELPDVVENLQGVDNLINLTAVDRKQLLDNGRTLISTLAEHIRYEGRGTLSAYYVLDEAAGERLFRGQLGTEPPMSVDVPQRVTLSAQAMTPGDDISAPVFSGAPVGANDITPVAFGRWDPANVINFTSSQTVTIVAWLRPTPPVENILFDGYQLDGGGSLFFGINGANGQWNIGASVAGWGPIGGVDAPSSATLNVWTLVAWRFKLQDTQELWINRTVHSLSFGAGAPASSSISQVSLSSESRWCGSIAHLQIYVSSGASDYTYAQHLAQLDMAQQGAVFDRTDERIARILRYASPNAAVPVRLDEGTTYMQRASMRGRKPGQLIDDAVDTEVGRLYVDGAGTLQFHNRVRAHYNL